MEGISGSDNTNKGATFTVEHILLALVIAAGAYLFLPTFEFLWQKWNENSQYSMAYLVPVVSGYFIWQSWPQVTRLKRSPSNLGLPIIVFAVLLHIAGVVLDISGPSSVALLLCILGGCIYFHGTVLVRVLWFPLTYSVFMVPVPGGVLDLVGFPLQLGASGATASILNMFGMEVVRNGVNMSVPGFDFQVAQACSGMSSLVALVGVTAVFAYLTKLPNPLKWVLFLLALPVAFAANVFRITSIALVGYQWGPDAAMNIFHDWSSPILFLAGILLLFAINGVFEWLISKRATSQS